MRVEECGVSLEALRFVGKLKRVQASLVAVASSKDFGSDSRAAAVAGGVQVRWRHAKDYSKSSVARAQIDMVSIAAIGKFLRAKKRIRDIALGQLALLEDEQISSGLSASLRTMQQNVDGSVGAGMAQLRFLGKLANKRKVAQAEASARASSQPAPPRSRASRCSPACGR
jgi:hypothetical protein